MKARGLGRGLAALLDSSGEATKESLATLPLDDMQRGKYQPRTRMDEASIAELADSIKRQGLMQPILVRSISGSGGKARYEIIAGERRWHAARLAGLTEVPVLVREVPDSSALAMALIENIQRENLNPLEEAAGIQRLITEFKLTHEEAAQAVGRSRTATTNLLRLLNLAKAVQKLMFDGKLEMGHARALLALDTGRQEMLARQVAEKGLSVRQTERLVQEALHPKVKRTLRTSRDVQRYADELSERFGTAIELKPGKKGTGKLVIRYASAEHLDDLLARFK
ncbi:MAG: ParB/RepB/Spo0J family partition protein [Betaproteobacteria bacterium]|nr:ParB/RepB/Spo0J family partition protein [Betaproteobacteria bacterium]